jgi:xylulokinase
MQYLLGVDLGTSGTKTVLFDFVGNAVCSKTIEYPLYQPANGWAEQDPSDWWNATCNGIKRIFQTKNAVSASNFKQ